MYYLDTNSPMKLYEEKVNSKIYVDKSLLIKKINEAIRTDNKYICITRPRRFGKTINANMLGAYYTKGYDSRKLYKGLKIENTETYEKHLNQHHVIYIDLSRMPNFCDSYDGYIKSIYRNLMTDIKEAYGLDVHAFDSVSSALNATKDDFIFILDEWDSIFYKTFMTSKDKQDYLEFLKGLLKDQPYVELAYMTGVLPIAKYSSGSELNMFKAYDFMNDYIFEDYYGFSENEVKELCMQYPTIPYETLKFWYDGYSKHDGTSLFNPRSVSAALSDGVCLNYWTETGPMNEVADCIEHNVDAVREDIVKMVSGQSVEVELQGYSAVELQLDSRDEILSAMVVYGFLSYNDGMLRIPNHELMEKFQRTLSRESMGEVSEIVKQSKDILMATINMDGTTVSQYVEEVHNREIPFLQYNDENSLSCVITLCYLKARDYYRVTRESKSAKGYVDFLFQPIRKGYPAIVLELKCGHSAQEAIAQIKKNNYMDEVRKENEILLVGINYNPKTKEHQTIIEKYK